MINDLYSIKLNEDDGVFSISFVDEPANKTDFVLLNKETKIGQVNLSNEDKMIVTGVVLIPNQIIERRDHNMVFDEKSIEELAIRFYQNGYQTNSNFQHNQKDLIHDCVFFESWIVKDPLNDKSNSLGFKKLPVGTWLTSAKILKQETWDRIKTGDYKGFSIEAFLSKELLDMSKNKNYENKMSLLKELQKIVDKLSAVESVKLYQVGEQVENKGMDYSFVDGDMTVYVDALGIIVKIEPTEQPAQDIPAELEAVEPVVENKCEVCLNQECQCGVETELSIEEDVNQSLTAINNAVNQIDVDTEQVSTETERTVEQMDIELLKKLVADLQAQVGILEQEKSKLEMSVEVMSAEPSVSKLKSNEVSNSKETRLDVLSRIANKK